MDIVKAYGSEKDNYSLIRTKDENMYLLVLFLRDGWGYGHYSTLPYLDICHIFYIYI